MAPRRVVDVRLREIARYFYAFKDVLRLRILLALARHGEMTVTDLSRELRVSQPLVSFHLRPLRVLGLVQVRRSGREVYYSADLSEIRRRQREFAEMLDEAVHSEE